MHVLVGCLLPAFWAVTSFPARATEFGVGKTTANFLKIGTNSRAVGLGEAVTAMMDGISYVGYNPAAVHLSDLTLSATHTAIYDGVNLEEVALGIPFGKKAGMIIRGNGILFDKTDRTDVNGNRTGTFGSASYAAGAGFYVDVGRLTVGVFGKSIQQKIDAFKASTVAADIGMRFRTPLPGVSLGVSLLNVGRPVKFIQQSADLPSAFRAGIAYDGGFIKLAADGVQYNDQSPFVSLGVEFSIFSALRLRAGYSDNSELRSPFKAGIGFRFSSLELDYAYSPGVDFGVAHRVSLTIR